MRQAQQYYSTTVSMPQPQQMYNSNIQQQYSSNISPNLQMILSGPLVDIEGAKKVAQILFSQYDTNRQGELQIQEMQNMIQDAYKFMSKTYTPEKQDVDQYSRVLDVNHDGKITIQDIEQLAIKYLVGGSTRSDMNNSMMMQSMPQQKRSSRQDEKLIVARQLFKKYDRECLGYITEVQVYPLIQETYSNIGINFSPTQKDVQEFLSMANATKSGRITLEDYENLILTSLRRSGIQID